MFPRQAIYKLLLRQGLIIFARVGTAVHCLPSMFPSFYPWHWVTIWEPNGIKAILANLKCCNPNGIPTIVIHHNNPKKQDVNANSQPNINIQITFSKKFPTPFEKTTSLPKGQKTNEAYLKHWMPAGMAIIVQQQTTSIIPHINESRETILSFV